MKPIGIVILGLFLHVAVCGTERRQSGSRYALRSSHFIKAFNDGFVGPDRLTRPRTGTTSIL